MRIQVFFDIAYVLHTTPENLSPDRLRVNGKAGKITSLYEDLTPENKKMIEQMIRALPLQQQMPPA